MKDPHVLATLLVQIAAILALSRGMGLLFARLRQPQVIGEMLAGIMLGPSLLGWVWPDAFGALFPIGSINGQSRPSTEYLFIVAQVGVVLFLFLVGLEFDPSMVRRRGRAAVTVSAASIVLPFAAGFGLTYAIAPVFDAVQQANLFASALFMGAAVSVTAFPVLARILAERNLQRTPVGMLAITAAAINDVVAWVMLAVVVAVAHGSGSSGFVPVRALVLIGVYLVVMLLVVRPLLERLQKLYDAQGRLSHSVVAVIFLCMLGSAFATEVLGIHALFGAFVAGFVMPKGTRFVRAVTERMEDLTIVFLLPIFFAYAGLQTDLRGILSPQYALVTLLIIVVACAGKVLGTGGAAMLCGQKWREALTLGALMNTRGLMELIILTVGLQLGVINDRVYGMMVVMALVTTAMTAPLLHLLQRGGVPDAARPATDDRVFSVLIPVARPESGGPLLGLAAWITGGEAKRRVVALTLDRMSGADLYGGVSGPIEHLRPAEALEPLLLQARERNLSVEPMSYFSRDVPSDIARVARVVNSDLVLIGHHQPVFGRALLGGIVHRVLTTADCDVAVYVERGMQKPTRILVPFMNSSHDRLALDIAGKIAKSTGASISIIHVSQQPADVTHPVVERAFKDPTQKQAVTIKIVPGDSPAEAILAEISDHDLVVIGVAEEWGLESSLLGMRPERIAQECPASMLIVRKYLPT